MTRHINHAQRAISVNKDHTKRTYLALIGPTCAGKTYVANTVSHHIPVNIMNLDSFMLYDYFKIGTGRYDAKSDLKHMYGILQPMEKLRPPEYLNEVKVVLKSFSATEKVMFEGGSISLVKALTENLRIKLIGVKPPTHKELLNNVHSRVENMFNCGLVEEVTIALQLGYERSKILKDDVVYLPVVEYLNNSCEIAMTKDRIIINIMKMIERQLSDYEDYDIKWVEPTEAIDIIIDAL